MKSRCFSILVVLVSIAFALPALAQGNSDNNSTGIEQGARDMYHGTKTGVKDTAITAKVKSALLSDKETKGYSIRVGTHGNGIVELSGDVPSRAVAHHAAEIAQNVSGVRTVRNDLSVRRNEVQ
jgi:osmotically-inducible protein OsmY